MAAKKKTAPGTSTTAIDGYESWSADALEAAVAQHHALYWEKQAPEISDYDFDRLVVRLRELRPDAKTLEKLGESEETLGQPVTHARPMLSLDKCYGEADLNDWASRIDGDFVVMPKLDGIACSLRYGADGTLEVAATRGTGTVGDDVTVNARGITEIPPRVGTPGIEVRGEVYMRLSVFAKFKDTFANPRNLTAGAMKQKDSKKSAAYGLSFAAYDLQGTAHATEREKFQWLKDNGFAPPEVLFVKQGELQAGYEEFARRRPDLDFEIDGVVFRANVVKEQTRLGLTSHHPRWAIAYKFQGESGRTKLNDVEWSVSRTGAITPVALIEPVTLSGASVSRASLHHPGYVKKLGLSRGCEVVVTRRGGVIPHVEHVVAPGTEALDPPTSCPACGSPVAWDGDFLNCTTPGTCVAARVGVLAHYAAVTEMLGFGDKLLLEAYTKGVLKTAADFYTVKVEQLVGLERVGDKLAQRLIATVESRKALPLATFLRALGIPELGNHVSALLAAKYGTLDAILAVTIEELAAQHSIGDVIAKSVVEGLAAARPLIEEIRPHVTLEAPKQLVGGTLEGLSFVFTGKLEAMDRKLAQDAVRNLGAQTPSGVSKDLSYLVCGAEKDGAKSSKQVAAEKHIAKGAALKVLDEPGFLKLLEEAKAGVRPV